MGAIDNYFSALERLKNNTPVVLPKGARISKDTVALEAGRKRSSIKKSRPQFENLIAAIELASSIQSKPTEHSKDNLDKIKSEKAHYRALYHESLNRELMLVKRLAELEQKLRLTPDENTNNLYALKQT